MELRRKDSFFGFTLVELLIVVGILAVLVAAVIIVLNPVDLLNQSRDGKRFSDLDSLNRSLLVIESLDPDTSFGSSQTVYISVSDPTLSGSATSTCSSLNLPSLPSGWVYNCVSDENLRKTDGTGWIPVDFSLSGAISFDALPIDPVNATSTEEYYTYTPGGSWVLTAKISSNKYLGRSAEDGGNNTNRYEVGNDISLISSTVFGGAQAPASFSAALSTVSVDLSSVEANGSSVSTITITVNDANGDPMTGKTVTLSSTGSGNSITQPAATTNASGQTTGTIASSVAEAKTITASVSGEGTITQTASVTFSEPCSGVDYAGADYSPSNGATLASACNVGTFTVAAGTSVNLPSQQKVEIHATTANVLGTINGAGKGYAAHAGTCPGTVYGGGAYGGDGGPGDGSTPGSACGSATSPNDFGSGGYAAGGGYVKLVVSGTLTVSGTITVKGASADHGGGAGGGIYISAGTLAGAGSIIADGGNATTYWGRGSGGGGRIALYYGIKTFSGTLTAYSGTSPNTNSWSGGAGTIYQKDTDESFGTLTIDRGNMTGTYTNLESSMLTTDNEINLTLQNKAIVLAHDISNSGLNTTVKTGTSLYLYGTHTIKSLTVESGGTALSSVNTTTKTNYIDLTAQTVSINSGATMTVSGRGYSAGNGPGAPVSGTYCGGGYGGNGGVGSGCTTPGQAYGSETAPNNLGSGGYDSKGGGYVKLVVSGTLTVSGFLVADGNSGTNSGGAGGGIYISAGTLAGAGTISANGANVATCSRGGGGGGRIALYYTTKTYSGTPTVTRGIGGCSSGPGADGTLYDGGAGSYPGPLD